MSLLRNQRLLSTYVYLGLGIAALGGGGLVKDAVTAKPKPSIVGVYENVQEARALLDNQIGNLSQSILDVSRRKYLPYSTDEINTLLADAPEKYRPLLHSLSTASSKLENIAGTIEDTNQEFRAYESNVAQRKKDDYVCFVASATGLSMSLISLLGLLLLPAKKESIETRGNLFIG